jgi:hypothetical protein
MGYGGTGQPTGSFGYSTVYYPPGIDPREAAPVSVGSGERIEDVDFFLDAVPVTTVTGSVRIASGEPTSGFRLSGYLSPTRWAAGTPARPLAFEPDGSFRVLGVVPGEYRVVVRADRARPDLIRADSQRLFWAVADVTVDATTAPDLRLRCDPGRIVRGTIVWKSRKLAGRPTVRLRLTPPRFPFPAAVIDVAAPDSSDTAAFELRDLGPEAYRVGLSLLDSNQEHWVLRTGGMPDGPSLDGILNLQIKADANLKIEASDSPAEISGSLNGADGRPALQYFLVLIPCEGTKTVFFKTSPRVERPATDGTFRFSRLWHGEHCIYATTDVDPAWPLDTLLADPSQAAFPVVRVSLAAGEQKRQNLTIDRQRYRPRSARRGESGHRDREQL